MATDILPTVLFPGILQLDADGSGNITGATASKKYILIPIDSTGDVTGLTAAEAAPATGDGRKVAYELIKVMHAAIDGLATASKPNRAIFTTGALALVDDSTARKTFGQQFDLTIASMDVAVETTTTTTTTTG